MVTLKREPKNRIDAVIRRLRQEYTLKEIDAMITEGLADIKRGDTIIGEKAFRMLRARRITRANSPTRR